MSEQAAPRSPARLNFSPDQLTYSGYETASADFITCLRAEDATGYLAALHADRENDRIHTNISGLRSFFDAATKQTGQDPRIGEAFEDGALIATVIAELHYKYLLPAVGQEIEVALGDYASYYGIFSDQQKDFVAAVREDGARHYKRYAGILFPIIDYVNDEKYGTQPPMLAMAEGASFVLERVRAAHEADYTDFEITVETMELLHPDDRERRNLFGKEVTDIIFNENAKLSGIVDIT